MAPLVGAATNDRMKANSAQRRRRGPREGGPMRIVVATDGSRGGCAAVKFATRLASRDPGTDLIILTIGQPVSAEEGNGHGAAVADIQTARFRAREKEGAVAGIPV